MFLQFKFSLVLKAFSQLLFSPEGKSVSQAKPYISVAYMQIHYLQVAGIESNMTF